MEKRKNRPQRIFITGMGCLLALGMLLLGGMLGVLMGVLVLPDVLGYDATQSALSTRSAMVDETVIALAGRELALANTQSANDSLATQQALDALMTLAALTNQQNLIDQTATGSARDILATQTGIAVANARQGTQVALDYEATQAQLQQEATRIQVDYQRTQAALGYDVQVDAQVQPAEASPTPTPTPSATRTPSPTPTPTELPRIGLDDDFTDGLTSLWEAGEDDAWQVQTDNLRASQQGAWLWSVERYFAPYRLYVGVTPALADSADYAITLIDEDDNAYAIVYEAQGLQVQHIALYTWDATEQPVWDGRGGRLLVRQQVDGLLIGNTAFVVTLRGGQVRVELNATTVLRHALDGVGFRVGVVLPMGAQLNKVTLTPLTDS